MCYRASFMEDCWATFLHEFGTTGDEVDPDAFVRFAFARAMAARQPAYATMARNWGVTVTAEEVATAKRRLVAAAVYARDGLATGANVLGRALATGQSVEDVESWPQRIEAVTVEQVNAALRAILREESSVTGVLLPKPTS